MRKVRSLRRCLLLPFPNRSAPQLAATAQQMLRASGVEGEICEIGRSPPPGPWTLTLLIFPILGDDRLPAQLDQWLHAHAVDSELHALWILGDFPSLPPRSQGVASEAGRLLTRGGSRACGEPLWLDTPVADPAVAVTPWLRRLLDTDGEWQAAPTHAPAPEASVRPEPAEAALRQLFALLPAPPSYLLDEQGRCISLTLLSSGSYPRSLLTNGPPGLLGQLMELLHNLPMLSELGLPFANLKEGLFLPPWIVRLDLRGNAFSDLSFLAPLRGLDYLNLAGSQLLEVPPVLSELPQLATLLLHKNCLESLPGWLAALAALERLSVYRNQLREVDAGILGASGLRGLNLGANPLLTIPDDLAALAKLRELGLRAVGLRALPPAVVRLPALRFLDLSKNPDLNWDPAMLPGVLVSEHLPRWT